MVVASICEYAFLSNGWGVVWILVYNATKRNAWCVIRGRYAPRTTHHVLRIPETRNLKLQTPNSKLLSLFLFLFALYLLTYAPTFHSSDGLAMFATAESLARRGAWDVEQIRWMGLQQGTFGRDGLLYSRKGVGQPLLALPLTWLGLALPPFGPATATLLFGSLVTALTGALVMAYLRRLGYDDRTALAAGLVYGAGTLAWPYAKTFFSDTLAGTLLLAGSLALLRFRQTGRDRFAALGGLALGWAVATRYAEAVFLPIGGLLLLAYLWRRGDRRPAALARSLAAFAAPPFAIGVGVMAFNYARYGDPFNTGYLPQETFSAVWWRGILGQLLSPGRGLLLYNPLLFLTFFGLREAHRRHPAETRNALAVILVHLLLYGKWFMWHGGFAWGPRFMVASLPFWALLMAPALEMVLRRRSTPLRWAFWGLAALTLLLQIPALAVDFDLWQNRLLETGLPLFAPETFFRLRYSPLVGTWAFLRPENLDVAWANDGRIAGGVLALLLLNLAAAGWSLGRMYSPSLPTKGAHRPLSLLLTLTTVAVLLGHAHRSWPASLRRALLEVNRLPAAPLVYDDPQKAVAVSEWYAGRAPVLGLTAPETERLAAVTASAPAVWWLTTFGGETEARLLATHGVARAETFDGVRLLLLAAPDAPPQTMGVRLGDAIILQQVRLSSTLRPPYPLAATLTWRATRPPPADYHVFLHLLNAAGQIVAQSDGQPVHWTRPTSTWPPDEAIADPYALSLPPDLPPGAYTLIGGLYRPDTGERLLTPGGRDSVTLGEFVVAP